MTQELPKWAEIYKLDPSKRRPKAPPSPADVAKAKKKSALAPPKWEPEIPKLHVRIELHGSMTFRLEGEQAQEFRALLTSGVSEEEVIEHLDPWSSGIEILQEIRVLEDPDSAGGAYHRWSISEERGSFDGYVSKGGPFVYTLESASPDRVDWRQVQ